MNKSPKEILMQVQGIGNNDYLKRGQENVRWILIGAGAGFVIASYYNGNKWIGLLAGSIIGGIGSEVIQNIKPKDAEKKE